MSRGAKKGKLLTPNAKNCRVLVLTLTSLTFGSVFCDQLIRPLHIYQNVIKSIHDYFNNTCIVLMYATRNSLAIQDLREAEDLLSLQKYFSSSHHVRTAIMDIETFRKKIGLNYYNIKRPLFVLLNDSEDVKNEFTDVSKWISMAYPTWLAFLAERTSPREFLLRVHVPFDCTFIVARAKGDGESLTELYQVARNKVLRSHTFGSWSQSRGFKAPTLGLYQRRNNLFGQQIALTAVEDPPLTTLIREENGEIKGMGGSLGALLSLLQQNMNCTFVYSEVKQWSEVIETLRNNSADMAVNELMMTAERMEIIDFTTPVFTTKCRTFIKTPTSKAVKWQAYLAPFHTGIWHSLEFLIVVTSLAISLIRAAIRILLSCLKDHQDSPSKTSEIIFHVFGAFCNQGMPCSLLDPVRLVHLAIHLTAVVVLAAYSAALVSFLAVNTLVMPFTTMLGLLKDETYRFAAIADSADYKIFQDTTDETLRSLFADLLAKETDLPANYLEGLGRLCQEKNYAFVMTDNTAATLKNKVECTFEPLDTIMQISVAMAMRRGCPYLGIVNSNILAVRDSGVLQRLLKSDWSYDVQKSKSEWTSVEMNDVLPLLLFFYFSVLVSVILFFVEKIIFSKFQRPKKTKRKSWKRRLNARKMLKNNAS